MAPRIITPTAASGVVEEIARIEQLNPFPADATKYLDGTGAYTVPAGTGTGTVTNTGTLTDHAVIVGNGGVDVSALASLGTTTTVLHGNAAADPAFSTVVEADITLANNTTNDVTTSAHGFAPKGTVGTTQFWRQDWTLAAPSGAGNVTTSATLTSGVTVVGNGGTDVALSALTATVVKATTGTLSAATAGTDYVVPGVLVGIQVITATGAGTYTPTSGTVSVVIELQGAGGGGAGADGSSGNNAVGMSGGGGAWLRKRLTANFSGAGYVVGAKGTGGASGNGTGNDGANTTFTDTAGSPVTYTAGGGTGGSTGGPFVNFIRPGDGTDGTGGTATNGDVNTTGGYAEISMCLANGTATSGSGGRSMYSGGAQAATIGAINTSLAGNAAGGKGGGGGGAVCSGTATALAGGDGSDGVIIIWEYR